jgi:hypothetical protein
MRTIVAHFGIIFFLFSPKHLTINPIWEQTLLNLFTYHLFSLPIITKFYHKKLIIMKEMITLQKYTIKTLCAIFFGLFLATSCVEPEEPIKPKPPIDNPTNYPIDIPFTEFSLEETPCQWANLGYDGKIIIINSREGLEQYIECSGGNYTAIDFSRNTLLLVSGSTQNGVYSNIEKLEQLSATQYKLYVKAILNDDKPDKQWSSAIVISKLKEEALVELHLTTIAENIENLYDQPLEVIQATVLGKWQVTRIFWTSFTGYTDFESVFVDITKNEVLISARDTLELSGFWLWRNLYFLERTLYTSFSYSWERKTVIRNWQPRETTYVMQNNDYEIEGWYFLNIKNDELYVWVDLPPMPYYAYYRFVRIKDENHKN